RSANNDAIRLPRTPAYGASPRERGTEATRLRGGKAPWERRERRRAPEQTASKASLSVQPHASLIARRRERESSTDAKARRKPTRPSKGESGDVGRPARRRLRKVRRRAFHPRCVCSTRLGSARRRSSHRGRSACCSGEGSVG